VVHHRTYTDKNGGIVEAHRIDRHVALAADEGLGRVDERPGRMLGDGDADAHAGPRVAHRCVVHKVASLGRDDVGAQAHSHWSRPQAGFSGSASPTVSQDTRSRDRATGTCAQRSMVVCWVECAHHQPSTGAARIEGSGKSVSMTGLR